MTPSSFPTDGASADPGAVQGGPLGTVWGRFGDRRSSRLALMWSDDPADRDFRKAIAVMAAQSQEVRAHDVEYG